MSACQLAERRASDAEKNQTEFEHELEEKKERLAKVSEASTVGVIGDSYVLHAASAGPSAPMIPDFYPNCVSTSGVSAEEDDPYVVSVPPPEKR